MEINKINYFWIRIYHYKPDLDSNDKSVLLDEYYLKDVDLTRNDGLSVNQVQNPS